MSHIHVNNITTMSCTKDIDIRCKYVNEYVEDGILNIIFKFLKMTATFSQKNISAELHEKHSRKMIDEKLEFIPSFQNI